MLSIYHDICSLRWPGYKVEGSGPIAVVLECARRVVLCELPLEAAPLRDNTCGPHCYHAVDNRWHFIRILNGAPKHETPYRPRPASMRIARMVAAAD